MKYFYRYLLVAFLLGSAAAVAGEIVGKVVAVYDGDTITVLDSSKTQHKIRLAEIDTPERNQAFGTRAKHALSSKVFGKAVTIKYDAKDRYGRIIGSVILDGRNINSEMIASGMAWHYKQYSKSRELANAESRAREKGLGLWADKDPTPPWDFRRGKSSKKSKEVVAAGDKQYWLNTSSNSRHNQSCRYFNNTKRGRVSNAKEGKACGMCGG